MATSDSIDPQAFEVPLPAQHDESHPLRLLMDSQRLSSDFEDPADRLTVCELPRKSLRPGS
jgi:hypothetical protein